MRRAFGTLVALFWGGVLLTPAGGADEAQGRIAVTAFGFKNQEGRAIVTIYRRGAHWLDSDRAYRSQAVPVRADSVAVTFDGLPYDTYAVNVVHDQNENGKLDMRWFPWPRLKEGAGVSNNHTRRGPPEYDKAKFEVDRDRVSIRIQMRY